MPEDHRRGTNRKTTGAGNRFGNTKPEGAGYDSPPGEELEEVENTVTIATTDDLQTYVDENEGRVAAIGNQLKDRAECESIGRMVKAAARGDTVFRSGVRRTRPIMGRSSSLFPNPLLARKCI